MVKSVSFGTIEVIEIERTIGDNPSVLSGSVPVTLEWDAHTKTTLPVDAFEDFRPHMGRVRVLSPRSRRKTLLKKGFSSEEIEEAILEASKSRKQRATTVYQLKKIGALKIRPPAKRRTGAAMARNVVVPMAA